MAYVYDEPLGRSLTAKNRALREAEYYRNEEHYEVVKVKETPPEPKKEPIVIDLHKFDGLLKPLTASVANLTKELLTIEASMKDAEADDVYGFYKAYKQGQHLQAEIDTFNKCLKEEILKTIKTLV